MISMAELIVEVDGSVLKRNLCFVTPPTLCDDVLPMLKPSRHGLESWFLKSLDLSQMNKGRGRE